VKASSAAQLRLLDLQAADTTLDQLAHRRSHLPELAEIADLERKQRERRDDVVRAETRVADLDRDQRKQEGDVEQVRSRAARDQQRLLAGPSAREAESLQHEVDSLARRQAELEDQLLEVMEQHEEADAELARASTRAGEARTALSEAVDRRDGAFADIDAASAARRAEREAIAAEIPDDLLTLYEKIRASSGGTGAARLFQRRCEGCHLELSGSDLSAVREAAEDEVVRCEECRRILVRTPESGL
jgi:predicted  nucleic acid-binding Zn-ribbon protein